MKEFKDKVAVITGAASGIGRAIAQRCSQEGMKVVLADVEEKALNRTQEEMEAAGASVLAVLTDVSKERDVESLAQKSVDVFGGVHLLFNNAGVVGDLTPVWKNTIADWEWVLGVNLWGVIYGIRIFVPLMLEQNTECHIVNTASISGITSGPGLGVYKVSKHGVVTLSETLYNELARKKANVNVSVLCPNWVSTQIVESDRNRPFDMEQGPGVSEGRPGDNIRHQVLGQAVQAGMPPEQVADIVFDAIKAEKFYILTHEESKPLIQLRMEDILQGRNPTNPL